MILDHKYYDLENVPLKVKQPIHTIDNHPSDYKMTCNRDILSFVNNLNKMNLNHYLLNNFSTQFYNERSDISEHNFRVFIKPSTTNIDHPALLEGWNSNLDK